MKKGRGIARRWAVEFAADGPSSSSSAGAFPDPLGFNRSSPDQDYASTSRQKKDAEAAWKSQKAWEIALASFKNLLMMGFAMRMAGSTVHLFSIGITFSALWQPINALQTVGKDKPARVGSGHLWFLFKSPEFESPLLTPGQKRGSSVRQDKSA